MILSAIRFELYPTNELVVEIRKVKYKAILINSVRITILASSRLSGATLEIYAESEDIRKDNAF
jgi:hypothetical protein